MANPYRGEASLEIENVVYTLRYDWNVLTSIETELQKPMGKIAKECFDVDMVNMTTIRTVLWYGLRKCHPNITREQAGTMCQEAGGFTKLLPVLNVAMGVAFPEIIKAREELEAEILGSPLPQTNMTKVN